MKLLIVAKRARCHILLVGTRFLHAIFLVVSIMVTYREKKGNGDGGGGGGGGQGWLQINETWLGEIA